MSEKFEEWWQVYPKSRRQGKAAALKKWKEKKLDAIADTIIGHTKERASKDLQWQRGFTPMPATFLNQERWHDEYESLKHRSGESTAQVPQAHLDYLQLIDDDWYWAVRQSTWKVQPKQGPIADRIKKFNSLPEDRKQAAFEKYGLVRKVRPNREPFAGEPREEGPADPIPVREILSGYARVAGRDAGGFWGREAGEVMDE